MESALHTIEIAGKIFETIVMLRNRLHISHVTLQKLQREGLPYIKIARRRYFERTAVDDFLLKELQ